MSDNFLVLIADDQPHIMLTLEYLVKRIHGAQVATTNSGQEAVKKAIDLKPKLVLLDVMMPDMDGYTACQAIREAWGEYAGQIWFITARGSHTDRLAAEEAGANRIINKPFDPDLLTKQITATLRENEYHLDT